MSYGVSVTTLEEVFLKVGQGIEDEDEQDFNSLASPSPDKKKERAEPESQQKLNNSEIFDYSTDSMQ